MGDHGLSGDGAGHEGVRRSCDAVAEEHAARLHDELDAKPLDRALLSSLSSLLEQTAPDTAIADLCCAPGQVAARLAAQGARTVGIDLSEAMTATGRSRCRHVDFRVGGLLELPAEDAGFGAAVALCAIIHLAPGELRRAFAEAHRVLRLSFPIGDEVRHLDEWRGHAVDVDFRFLDPDRIAALLEEAGFTVEMRMERAPYAHEVETRRACLPARRPGAAA